MKKVPKQDYTVEFKVQAIRAQLTEYGMTASMSRRGNCWDNAPTESSLTGFRPEFVVYRLLECPRTLCRERRHT